MVIDILDNTGLYAQHLMRELKSFVSYQVFGTHLYIISLAYLRYPSNQAYDVTGYMSNQLLLHCLDPRNM